MFGLIIYGVVFIFLCRVVLLLLKVIFRLRCCKCCSSLFSYFGLILCGRLLVIIVSLCFLVSWLRCLSNVVWVCLLVFGFGLLRLLMCLLCLVSLMLLWVLFGIWMNVLVKLWCWNMVVNGGWLFLLRKLLIVNWWLRLVSIWVMFRFLLVVWVSIVLLWLIVFSFSWCRCMVRFSVGFRVIVRICVIIVFLFLLGFGFWWCLLGLGFCGLGCV